jgi:uncharacterized membrane protein HdeD (DUF308 family)
MTFSILGALALASLVAALFFLRFWRKTGDRFFMLFAIAFAFDAVGRVVLAVLLSQHGEGEPLVYALRLLTFSIILGAIVDKNRKGKGQ